MFSHFGESPPCWFNLLPPRNSPKLIMYLLAAGGRKGYMFADIEYCCLTWTEVACSFKYIKIYKYKYLVMNMIHM